MNANIAPKDMFGNIHNMAVIHYRKTNMQMFTNNMLFEIHPVYDKVNVAD